jgi:membrane protein DedA with SNARE-associated domain
LNFLAAGLWAGSFIAVGYFLGHAFRAVLGDIGRYFGLAMLGVFVLISGGVWLLHRVQRRHQSMRLPAAVLPPPAAAVGD